MNEDRLSELESRLERAISGENQTGLQQFKSKGWKVLFGERVVSVVSPLGKSYHVCDKRFGKHSYDAELKRAYERAERMCLI